MKEGSDDVSVRACWICGAAADSREHRIKRTAVARAGGDWSRDERPLFVGGVGLRWLQGPDSKLVKFPKVLCHSCNTARTQPYDVAFDAFSRWVEAQGDALLSRTQLDFEEIFGSAHRKRMLDLFRYFVKLLGCRISELDDFPLPATLAQSFDREDLAPFGVSFSLNPSYLGVTRPGLRGTGIAGNYSLIGSYSASTRKKNETYVSGTIVGYVDVLYRYDWPDCFPWEGELLHAPKRLVALGRFDPKSSDEHLFPPVPENLLAEIEGRQSSAEVT